LDTIIGKSLRLVPDQRYDSVGHLAEDLRRFLGRRPIAARRPGFFYSARLALVRHRFAAAAGGVGLVLFVTAGVIAWFQHLDSVAHAERTAAVRDFMFDLVDDAESVEGHEGEVTGRQMVDGAVARARRDFGSQPQLQGELLGELGRMYSRLGALDAAEPVLTDAVSLLERHAPPKDVELNKTRISLASVLLKTDFDPPRIRGLAEQGREACANNTIECAKTRAYASAILSQLFSLTGDPQAALIEMRRGLTDAERGFGPNNVETAIMVMRVAILERNTGQLVPASEHMARAVVLAKGLELRAADRIEIERSMAVIDLDLGRYEAARDRLMALVASSAGTEGRATQYRLLATAYVELGDVSQALQSAAAAKAAIPLSAGNAEWPYTQQVEARALDLAGRYPEALADIDLVIARLLADGSTADSYPVLRAQRYRAQFLAHDGRDAEALQLLRDLRDRHGSAKAPPFERGLLLDALGEAELRAGNGEKSQLAHDEAAAQLLKQLPKDHPYVIRNATLRALTKQTSSNNS
jgi:tetratricopeptide (TPR) repeat protein